MCDYAFNIFCVFMVSGLRDELFMFKETESIDCLLKLRVKTEKANF